MQECVTLLYLLTCAQQRRRHYVGYICASKPELEGKIPPCGMCLLLKETGIQLQGNPRFFAPYNLMETLVFLHTFLYQFQLTCITEEFPPIFTSLSMAFPFNHTFRFLFITQPTFSGSPQETRKFLLPSLNSIILDYIGRYYALVLVFHLITLHVILLWSDLFS